jgi:hypothetical protein
MALLLSRGRRERYRAFSSQIKATILAVIKVNVFPWDRFRQRRTLPPKRRKNRPGMHQRQMLPTEASVRLALRCQACCIF